MLRQPCLLNLNDVYHEGSRFNRPPAVVAVAGRPGAGAVAAHVDHLGRTGPPTPFRAPAATSHTPTTAPCLGRGGGVAGRLGPLDSIRLQAVGSRPLAPAAPLVYDLGASQSGQPGVPCCRELLGEGDGPKRRGLLRLLRMLGPPEGVDVNEIRFRPTRQRR
jgi:hypothetical protein